MSVNCKSDPQLETSRRGPPPGRPAPEIRALIAELAEISQGRDDIRTECAGTLAGAWFASPATAYAQKLTAAGLLLLAGPVDGRPVTERVREGFERRRQALNSYNPSRAGPDPFARGPLRRRGECLPTPGHSQRLR
jgi:hypothetical protein